MPLIPEADLDGAEALCAGFNQQLEDAKAGGTTPEYLAKLEGRVEGATMVWDMVWRSRRQLAAALRKEVAAYEEREKAGGRSA